MKKNMHFDNLNNIEAQALLDCFHKSSDYVSKGKRNTLKNIIYKGDRITVKAFKTPNLLNRVIYAYFRPSKAKRSYDYAKKLVSLGIGTPRPLGYVEFKNFLGLTQSYYFCEYIDYDLTFRDISLSFNKYDSENILKAFTQFTHRLHENNILFLDHSPGNTLVKLKKDHFDFYLVDLNRMRFENLDLKSRINNFSRLTKKKNVVRIMSKEYAKITKNSFENIFQMMWNDTLSFRKKFDRKKRIKRQLKFWK